MAQLFIGQLPFSKFFPDDLLNLFRPYGNVVAHQLHIRQGNAFVTYATTDEADAAIRALHGQCALGTRSQPIQVMYSKGTRLISPFGLQHRSLCLARNKDRQRSKEQVSGNGTGGGAASNNNNNNNDSVSLNDGAAPGLFVGGRKPMEYNSVLYTTGMEEYSPVGSLSGAGGATFVNRGLSDISFDEDGRQTAGSGVFSNGSFHSLNASANRQMLQQQQQQQHAYMSGLIGIDPAAFYGSPVKWAMASTSQQQQQQQTPSVIFSATATPGQAPSNDVPSRLSSPAAPPLPPPSVASANAASTLSYVVMQPPSHGMTTGMPVCYVMPSSTASAYLQQQQQIFNQQQQQQAAVSAMMGPFGTTNATVLPPPLAYMQMLPMY